MEKFKCIACGWEFEGERGEHNTCPVCGKGVIANFSEGHAMDEQERQAGFEMNQLLKAWMAKHQRYAIFCVSVKPNPNDNTAIFEVYEIMPHDSDERQYCKGMLMDFIENNKERF